MALRPLSLFALGVVDSVEVMQDAMEYYYGKAMKEMEKGEKADHTKIAAWLDKAVEKAAKLAPYRHPLLSAVKIVGEKTNPYLKMTPEQIKASIAQDLGTLKELGIDVAKLPAPVGGVANRGNGHDS